MELKIEDWTDLEQDFNFLCFCSLEPTVNFTLRLPEETRVPVNSDAVLTVELSRPDAEVKWQK